MAVVSRALQQALDAAFRTHQAGQLDEAERLYREVLRIDPLHPDALHLLGLLNHQRGRSAEAEELIAEAIELRPDRVYYENLAAVQKSLGALSRVIETCRSGLEGVSSPQLATMLAETLIEVRRFAEALTALAQFEGRAPLSAQQLADRAFCLLHLGRPQAARSTAEQALSIDRGNGNALAVLAEVATTQGDHASVADLWARAAAARPDWEAARINHGLALARLGDGARALEVLQAIPIPADAGIATKLLNGLAAAYRANEKPDLARRSLEGAAALAPDSSEFLSNLSELRRTDASYACRLADRALSVDSGNAGAHNNRGLALEEQDFMGQAVASIRRAIAIRPADAEFLNNLGGPLRWLGHFHEAQTLYNRVLAIDRIGVAGWYGLGTVQLILGDLKRGWANYDWRTRDGKLVKPRPFQLPLWEGPSRSHGKLLVWGEQGLGDEIVYGSMLPDLVRAGIPAVVECDARMVGLFSRALPDIEFVARTNPPDACLAAGDLTAQLAMGGLGAWFRTRIEDFPPGTFLVPRPELVEHWRRRLAELGDGPKIGFAWRSRRTDGAGRRFHPPILEWAPVLSQRGATFISLQYGNPVDDIEAVATSLGTRLHTFADLDLFNDLEGILALSAALDLAISTASTGFCLPAAAGIPVWLTTPENDFWVFGTDRYPWFANIRLYAHRFVRPWSDTIGSIARDLAGYLRDRPERRATGP